MSDFRARIRDDGTVDGHLVETYYHEAERFYVDTENGFVGIIADGGGCDIETRVLTESLAAALPQVAALEARLAELRTPRPLEKWSEDDGDVLWWRFPVEEPPYCGSPLDIDWPGYHTHWTPLPTVQAPAPAAAQRCERCASGAQYGMLIDLTRGVAQCHCGHVWHLTEEIAAELRAGGSVVFIRTPDAPGTQEVQEEPESDRPLPRATPWPKREDLGRAPGGPNPPSPPARRHVWLSCTRVWGAGIHAFGLGWSTGIGEIAVMLWLNHHIVCIGPHYRPHTDATGTAERAARSGQENGR